MPMSLRQMRFCILFTALLICFNACANNSDERFQFSDQQAKTAVDVVDKLNQRHYRKLPFDDALSEQMLDKYVLSLDPAKAFFLQSDIDRFRKQYADHLDEALKKGNLAAAEDIYNVFLQRAHERLTQVIEQVESKNGLDFDYSVDESLIIDPDQAQWPADQAEADDLWRKRLKASALSLKLSDDEPEKIQKTLQRRYTNQLHRLEQQDSDDVFETFMNSLALLYDPHTTYFSPRTQENFNISMSLSLEGIGAVLQTEDEMTKVVRLVSGGPAAKQGDLQPADKIIAVGQGPEGEMVDVIGWRLDEVVNLIRGPKGTVVRLQVTSADGTDSSKKIISINRDKVKLEEQAAKKGIIELTDGDKLFKIGVIRVPAFYLDFEAYRRRDPNFKSTTTDVYKLLKELEQEHIDGLVLDLRNNGGGSLQEATTLTDLFIDQGPVVQIRQDEQSISRNYRSRRPATYRGPLVILTNRLSASASEIFAGAIQDYDRGLIVGTQSFGKGTVQSLTPVVNGQLKLTESKFYRVSGDSTQHRGVIPDIQFPFLVDSKEVGESSYDTALPWDQIHPVPHADYLDLASMIPTLTQLHQQRIADDPDFILMAKQEAQFEEKKDKHSLSLNEQQRRAEQNEAKNKSLALENQRRKAKGLDVFASFDDWEADRKERNEKLAEEAGDKELHTDNDAQLSEAGYILIDMINLMQKKIPRVANF